MPQSDPRPTVHRGPSFQSLTPRPRTPLDPSYQGGGSSSTFVSSLRPPLPRYDSRGSNSSHDRRLERSQGDDDEEEYALPEADLPMQVTETVVVSAIRLDIRMRELEEVADMFEDLKESCPTPEVFKELCFFFIEETVQSYYSVRRAWAKVDDLREHRCGTEEKLSIESDAAALVKRIEGWRHERTKEQKAASADKGRDKEKESVNAEEVKQEKPKQMMEFSELVKQGTRDWRREVRKENIKVLKNRLWDEIMVLPSEEY